MIRLVSAPSVASLARLSGCEARAKEAVDAGEVPPVAVNNCYRHPEVKASIVKETFDKCAYCESKITHVYWGDVEHIEPKVSVPNKRFDYENLTLACAICNNSKGDYYNQQAPILNPYVDEPKEHLVGLGPFVWHRNGSATGQRTIDLLVLNRDALNERRLECLQRLTALVDRYCKEPAGAIKQILAAQIGEETADSAEYALIARSFLLAAYALERDAL
jgi:hypothetical protein